MPLRKGSSKAVIAQNIKELRRAGYAPKQSVAIAMSSARRSGGGGFRGWARPVKRKGK